MTVTISGDSVEIDGAVREVLWYRPRWDGTTTAFKHQNSSGKIISVEEKVKGKVQLDGNQEFENPSRDSECSLDECRSHCQTNKDLTCSHFAYDIADSECYLFEGCRNMKPNVEYTQVHSPARERVYSFHLGFMQFFLLSRPYPHTC